jgi:penicillin-binding protein 2
VLASASNPDYNINEFNKKYKELSNNKNKPFFNRSLSGLYEPGSTFKPITAIAALQSGVLTPNEKIKTLGKYEYFDRVFRCNIYREKGKTHGRIDVSEALSVSCNYFFYELGKRAGINEIFRYAHSFGLDASTGIELSKEESIGTIASPDNRKARGGHWYAGDTLQAAIGQSDNQFTPIALCNYAAALANGGTLYSAHILKGVCENENKISYAEPKILNTLDILPKTMQTIREGMLMVTKSGTAKDVFSDFSIDVAGKTGTAQRGGRTNGLFIGYAPADNPKISFCVVVEGGASGNQAARILKEILVNYFNTDEKGN